jgi:hypothetical protein
MLTLFLFIMKVELPLEFPDGTTPVTCRVCVSIYDSSSGKKIGVGSLMDKASAPPLPTGSIYMEEVHVKVWFLQSLKYKLVCVFFLVSMTPLVGCIHFLLVFAM